MLIFFFFFGWFGSKDVFFGGFVEEKGGFGRPELKRTRPAGAAGANADGEEAPARVAAADNGGY